MESEIRFKAEVPGYGGNPIIFTLSDLADYYPPPSIRGWLIPWLQEGNKPEICTEKTTKTGKLIYLRNVCGEFQAIQDSEINFTIDCFWGDGFNVRLGNDYTGFTGLKKVMKWAQVEPALIELVSEHEKGSKFYCDYNDIPFVCDCESCGDKSAKKHRGKSK